MSDTLRGLSFDGQTIVVYVPEGRVAKTERPVACKQEPDLARDGFTEVEVLDVPLVTDLEGFGNAGFVVTDPPGKLDKL